jgi:hypothetical protein
VLPVIGLLPVLLVMLLVMLLQGPRHVLPACCHLWVMQAPRLSLLLQQAKM